MTDRHGIHWAHRVSFSHVRQFKIPSAGQISFKKRPKDVDLQGSIKKKTLAEKAFFRSVNDLVLLLGN